MIYGPKAMEHLRSISTVVYLKVNYRTLQKRLGDLNKRGVVLKSGQTLLDLYKERVPLYEQYAHRTVYVGGRTVQQAVEEIVNALKEL